MAQAYSYEQIETMTQLWREGLTAAQIGKQIGRTRNSVIGRLHRMGLSDVARGKVREPRRRRCIHPNSIKTARIKARVQRANMAAESDPPLPSLNVPFVELQYGQCKAVTDATPFAQRCCGHPTTERGVYCPAHEALHWTRTSKERSA